MDDTLIERLEAASEGSRELDEAIIDHFGWRNDFGTPIPPGFIGIPHYTSSIDHAMTLVPEGPTGWSWWAGNEGGIGNAFLIPNLENHGSRYEFDAATPALALCIAALRAQAGEKS